MSIIWLTQEERIRFASWCEQKAASNNGIATQMESLGPAYTPMVKKQRAEALACRVVAMLLASGEEVTITHGGSP